MSCGLRSLNTLMSAHKLWWCLRFSGLWKGWCFCHGRPPAQIANYPIPLCFNMLVDPSFYLGMVVLSGVLFSVEGFQKRFK